MNDPTNGITCPDMRRVIRAALDGGWKWLPLTGTNHGTIQWRNEPPIHFGLTPSVASWKTTATDIQRISGVEVWRKGNRKRSRKADQTSGFSITAAHRESAEWSRRWGARAAKLRSEHDQAVSELRRLASAGDRTSIDRARKVLAVIQETERGLSDLHQPFTPFIP